MTENGVQFQGNNRNDEIASDLDRIHYRNTFAHLWDDYTDDILHSEVVKLVEELKVDKDPGAILLTAVFIRFNVGHITAPLTNVFNTIMKTALIPNEWKKSFMIPVSKKGSSTDITNYERVAIQ